MTLIVLVPSRPWHVVYKTTLSTVGYVEKKPIHQCTRAPIESTVKAKPTHQGCSEIWANRSSQT